MRSNELALFFQLRREADVLGLTLQLIHELGESYPFERWETLARIRLMERASIGFLGS